MIALSLETEKNSFLLEMKKEQQTKAISRILEKNHIRNAVICSKEMCFALMGISINDTLLDTIVNDMIQKLSKLIIAHVLQLSATLCQIILNWRILIKNLKKVFIFA